MADTIQLRAGNKNDMPVLLDREIAYVRDEKAFYMGTPQGNVKVGKDIEEALSALQDTVGSQGQSIAALDTKVTTQGTKLSTLEGTVSEHTNKLAEHTTKLEALEPVVSEHTTKISTLTTEKLTATKAAAQSPLADGADVAAVVAAFNGLISALKASGQMNS